jgi:hypothetical protein
MTDQDAGENTLIKESFLETIIENLHEELEEKSNELNCVREELVALQKLLCEKDDSIQILQDELDYIDAGILRLQARNKRQKTYCGSPKSNNEEDDYDTKIAKPTYPWDDIKKSIPIGAPVLYTDKAETCNKLDDNDNAAITTNPEKAFKSNSKRSRLVDEAFDQPSSSYFSNLSCYDSQVRYHDFSRLRRTFQPSSSYFSNLSCYDSPVRYHDCKAHLSRI